MAKQSPAAQPSLIRIGRIVGIHGLRGGLRFRPDDPASESIDAVGRIFLADGERVDGAREYRITNIAQLGRGTIRLMLEGISDANLAESVKGKNVFADEDDLPPPGENEFYFRDIIGCEVFLTDGSRLGVVEEIMATGANEVFVVRDGDKEVLVPSIEDVVKEIDVDARRIVIEAIPGLLE